MTRFDTCSHIFCVKIFFHVTICWWASAVFVWIWFHKNKNDVRVRAKTIIMFHFHICNILIDPRWHACLSPPASENMKAVRSYRRGVATKAKAAITKTFNITTKKENDHRSDLSNAISIKKKDLPTSTEKAAKSAKDANRRAKIKEFFRMREEKAIAKKRKEYEKRRAARMIHSSNKLYLSHRLTSIIKSYSPQSPIECISLTSQFAKSNSKTIKITRDTRQARIYLHFKWSRFHYNLLKIVAYRYLVL